MYLWTVKALLIHFSGIFAKNVALWMMVIQHVTNNKRNHSQFVCLTRPR